MADEQNENNNKMAVEQKSDKKMQWVGGLAATMGGFSLGCTIGWSSPAGLILHPTSKGGYSDEEWSWISSIMNLGAAASMIFMALCFDVFGRKWIMVGIAPVFAICWVFIGFSAKLYPVILVLRFLTGFCGGIFCVAAPTYTAELSEQKIRGALGALFQMMVVSGILLSFCLGEANDLWVQAGPCIAFPVILGIVIVFLPESPMFLFKKGKEEQGRKALQFFRGKQYDIEVEIPDILEYVSEGDESKWQIFKQKATIRGFLMLLVLHVTQQMCGINAVMFNANDIFKIAVNNKSSADIGSNQASIILVVVQFLATAVCIFVVDRGGRRILWIISLVIMIFSLVVLGVFFIITLDYGRQIKELSFLPLLSLCIYLIGFSLAAGPLAWAMLGELLPNQVKSATGSFIAFFNWMLSFLVVRTYEPLKQVIGPGWLFIVYALFSVLSLVFVIFVLIETKGKSLEQIQKELRGSEN